MEQILDVVLTLSRTALATGSPAVRQQVERLSLALVDEHPRVAANLKRMLARGANTGELRPSRITRAAEFVSGETLPEGVQIPVDRETSTPLVEILRGDQLPEVGPILPPGLTRSVTGLLEEWASADKLRDAGMAPITSALFFGPPGTGKTQLALWLGRQLDLPVVLARLDGLISSFLGTTSRNIGALFHFAQRYRCMLMLDEFDAIAKMRDDPQEVGEIKRVVNTLLQNLDGRRGSGPTIAITNHEGLLDPAVWRRFDVQISLTLPSREARLEIMRRHMAPLPLTQAQLDFLVWCTHGTSGSDIETLMRTLKRAFIVGGANDFHLLYVLREYAYVNAARLDRQVSSAVVQPNEQLAEVLIHDGFDAATLSDLFGVHRTTVNRWLKHSDATRSADYTHA